MANQIPVNQLMVAQAHQEFTKLVDQISAKFIQLDLGEFGAVGTPAFDAKMHDLAVLFACMSQPCGRLNLPIPAHLHQPPFFKHLKWFDISAKFWYCRWIAFVKRLVLHFKNPLRLLSTS